MGGAAVALRAQVNSIAPSKWDYRTARELVEALQARRISASEIVEHANSGVGPTAQRHRCPRLRAHFCGIYAHKPSLGLVPDRGHLLPPFPAVQREADLAVVGPMARSAADLALALDVVAGPDEEREGLGYRLALPPRGLLPFLREIARVGRLLS